MDAPPPPNAAREASDRGRGFHLLLAMVIALAFVGFVVGLRQGVPRSVAVEGATAEPFAHVVSRVSSSAIPSMTWATFDRRTHGPNRNWPGSIADAPQPAVDLFAAVEWDEVSRAALLTERAARRAFDGAPPVVPHPIDQTSASACLVCHAEGLIIEQVRAPRMSHALMPNCTQCHVEQTSAHDESFIFAASDFRGLAAPTSGSRAWAGAPPTIPHATFMRESCMACHGPIGPEAIRSTHPWRANCLQCHAPSAALDQHVIDADEGFLPPPPGYAP